MTARDDYPVLSLRPVTLVEARQFVAKHHRHNDPPVTWRFGVGVECAGVLVGVAMAGLPKSRMLMAANPYLLEINRTCTTGERNANSMLYGAIARAAEGLGYRELITYTLADESGSSLRATGWMFDAVSDHDINRWTSANGQHATLFGSARIPIGPKLRWRKTVGKSTVQATAATDVPAGADQRPVVDRPTPAGTTPVNVILPRRGMPQHALDELAVDRANERRRERDRWGL